MSRHLRSALAVLVMCGAFAACGDDATTTTTTEATAKVTGTVTVSAAASLTESFTTIKDDFVEANPDVTVTINFGSSGTLSTQIQEGAPVDVAAFADVAPMTDLEDADLIEGTPEVFARNQLVIVTKPGNPKAVKGLADLADVGVVSLCADTAPCGKFADQVLTEAGVAIPPSSVTHGQDVKATLAAVTEGDAEAAIVYVTDATASGDGVDTVEIPEADNPIVDYLIAVVTATTNAQAATAFEEYVLGPEAQAVLKEAGFLAP